VKRNKERVKTRRKYGEGEEGGGRRKTTTLFDEGDFRLLLSDFIIAYTCAHVRTAVSKMQEI
jgi:hypothetical protein